MSLSLNTFRTQLGWCAMLGEGETLYALTFGHSGVAAAVKWLDRQLPEPAAADARGTKWNPRLAKRVAAMLEGEPDEFRDVTIDQSYLTPFARRVVSWCRKIDWGETRSYGQLAAKAGSAGAARAVGSVMASNRTPLIVPCHRVIASGGRLGGYSGPHGLDAKLHLLHLESPCECCHA